MKKINLIKGLIIVTIFILLTINTTSTIADRGDGTDINGRYFLRALDPNNWGDAGTLLREAPVGIEYTRCGMWVVFHFNESGNYDETYEISNIYYHIWQLEPDGHLHGNIFDLGYTTWGGHGGPMNESITTDTDNYVSLVNHYRLITVKQITDPEIAVFEGEDIYNFSVLSLGCGPNITCNPHQPSFVILNLEDNETLKGLDRDDDHITDYDELFIHFTDPFNDDTDGDGATDYEEIKAVDHGFTYSDPNNYQDTTDFRLKASLSANTYTISSEGGTINFVLDAGTSNADRKYIQLGGSTGSNKGFVLPGGLAILPLNWDSFTDIISQNLNSVWFSQFLGKLDKDGKATATLNLPPLPGGVGATFYFAYASNNPWDYASNSVKITVV